MNVHFKWLPSKPKPIARVLGYASNADSAERASSQIEESEEESTVTRIISDKIRFDTASLSHSSTAVASEATASSYFKDLPQTLHSFLKSLWQKAIPPQQDAGEPLREFKHENVADFPLGYPQFAAFLNSDENFSIFRKYGRVGSRTLLYLQAEIAALDKRLTELDINDLKDGSKTGYRLRTIKCDVKWDTTQKDIIKQLQEKLGQYYGLLLQFNQVKALGTPLKHNHQYVFNWIEGKKPVVKEEDNWILYENDLVALSPVDRLESSLTGTYLNRLFRPSKQGDGETEPVVTSFSPKRVTAAARALSVFIAVSILIVPVSILLWLPLEPALMSVTVLLSVLVFSTLLSFSMTMKTKDILLGSAAYCAVLATFLGNSPYSARS